MGAGNAVGTRQQGGTLYESSVPLGAAASSESLVFLAQGMARIIVSSIADTAHEILIEEANSLDGTFVEVEAIASSPVGGGLHRAAALVFPVGGYMRATSTNLGAAQTRRSLKITGLPT
jgi:hypothetical protein